MNKALLSTLALTVAVSVALLAGWVAPAAANGEKQLDPEKAKKLFVETHKCNMCHAVPAAEIEAKTDSEKMKGADLGGKIDSEFEEIAAYVRKQAELDGKSHKKEFKGTDEELQTILDWLGTLEAQK